MMMPVFLSLISILGILLFWQWLRARPTFGIHHVILDVETTGLDPIKHEVIEIAVIDIHGRILINTKIMPENIESASPEALAVNEYTPESWEGSPTWDQVRDRIFEVLDKKQVIGHNVNFDVRFIRAMFSKRGQAEPAIRYQMIDTSTLIFEHLQPIWNLEKYSLGVVVRRFWPELKAHRALDDAEGTRRLALKLAGATFMQKLWWKIRY